jgi:multicomponent K+:H+ antiporter subunit D
VVATLAAGALFLLKDIIDQILPAEAQVLAISLELYGDEEDEVDEDQEVSPTIPAGTSVVSWCFAIAALVMTGLPPLPGFIAKFAMISGAFSAAGAPTAVTWWFTGALMLSGLLVLVAMVRNGINIFWASLPEGEVVHLRRQEIGPIVGLLALCVLLSLMAGPVMAFFLETAAVIHAPGVYAATVLPGSSVQ